MFSVYMYISALYILFAPGSYTSHWLMFFVVNTTGNKAYLILSYLNTDHERRHMAALSLNELKANKKIQQGSFMNTICTTLTRRHRVLGT